MSSDAAYACPALVVGWLGTAMRLLLPSVRRSLQPLPEALLVLCSLLLATAAAATPLPDRTHFTATSNATVHPANTPLLQAILDVDLASVQRLLDAGANINDVRRLPAEAFGRYAVALEGRDSVKATPLLVAMLTRNLELIELLLGHGADPNFASDGGMTALLLAVERSELEIAERLIAAGADTNESDDADNTPLIAAVKRSDKRMVELLLAHDVDLDTPDDRGVTPLRAAIEIPNTELADLLVSHGASLEPEGDDEDHLDAVIEIHGFDAWLDVDRPDTPMRAAALGLAVDSTAGKLYWTEYQRGRIRRANLDGSDVETLVEVAGPVGIAVDVANGKLYWTTDGPYPWRIQKAGLDGRNARDLLSGRFVNRPTDMLLSLESAEKMYWAETVSGRIRRANLDGTGIEDIGSSGLGIEDRPGSEVTAVYGIALDTAQRALYWTELTHGMIQRISLESGEKRTLRDRSRGVSSPTGIAIDASAKKLYWADQASLRIQRAELDGSKPKRLLTASQDLARPWALALDLPRRKLYWTDLATDTIQRADFDGRNVELIVQLHPTWEAKSAGSGSSGTEACPKLPAQHVGRLLAPVEVCLDTVGAVKAVKAEADEAKVAAELCARQLLRLQNRAAPETTVSVELAADLERRCGTALDATQRHAIVREAQRLAVMDVARRYTRAREWLEEVRPFIAALPPPSLEPELVEDAIAALDAFDTELAELPRNRRNSAATGFPGSGLASSYRARNANDEPGFEVVPDDGAVRAGGALRYVDNADGTMTDINTGLMWEKKCDCPGDLHHYHREYRWSGNDSETIWDWLDAVNAENGSGFAGHRDWRIPNIKELHSIVDYERFNPAISAAFDAFACGLGCKKLGEPTCSCTEPSAYWSSTTFAEDPELAFVVGFNIGLVAEIDKQTGLPVRAVRNGAVMDRKEK